MLSNQTINTLRQLRLNGMADAYSRQLKDVYGQIEMEVLVIENSLV